LAKAQLPRTQYLQRVIQLDLLKHVFPKFHHGWLCYLSPNFMAKVKNLVSMGVRLGNIKCVADQGHQERIKNEINKFIKNLQALCSISFALFSVAQNWRLKPRDFCDLVND
jgi:hypothetical protein